MITHKNRPGWFGHNARFNQQKNDLFSMQKTKHQPSNQIDLSTRTGAKPITKGIVCSGNVCSTPQIIPHLTLIG